MPECKREEGKKRSEIPEGGNLEPSRMGNETRERKRGRKAKDRRMRGGGKTEQGWRRWVGKGQRARSAK